MLQGLNLIPLEYIYARSEPESAGVVLASEFSACSSLLNGAIRINPFDVAKTAGAMDQALTMNEAEKWVVESSVLEGISKNGGFSFAFLDLLGGVLLLFFSFFFIKPSGHVLFSCRWWWWCWSW